MHRKTVSTMYALIAALILPPAALHAQAQTIHVSKSDTARFDVRVRATSTPIIDAPNGGRSAADSEVVRYDIGGEILFTPRSSGRDTFAFNGRLGDAHVHRNGVSQLSTDGGRAVRGWLDLGDITVGADGGVIAVPPVTKAWAGLTNATLVMLGITQKHMAQFFFLQGALARHSPGERWERRRDDTATIAGTTITQHYTVHFQHDGAVDTLGAHTVRLHFSFAVDSITFQQPLTTWQKGTTGFTDTLVATTVSGHIKGVVYYDTSDGLVVAFETAHELENVITAPSSAVDPKQAPSVQRRAVTGSISIVRRPEH